MRVPPVSWFVYILPGLLYYVVANLSLFLAIPPSEAAAVWPAAGIAIGMLLLWGLRVLPGLCLGIFCFYLESWLNTDSSSTIVSSLILTLLMTSGPVLQALLTSRLIHHYLGAHNPLMEERSIIVFMLLAGPVGCLTAATIDMTVLTLFGMLPAADFAFNWLNWWVGDSIGAMVVTPLILILFGQSAQHNHSRKYLVGIPLFLLLILVFVFFSMAQRHEKDEFVQTFEKLVSEQHNLIQVGLKKNLDVLYFMKGFFESSEVVKLQDFTQFTHHALRVNPHIQALEWIPRVTHPQRQSFIAQSEAINEITEPGAQGGMVTAAGSDVYYPVKYVQPLEGNERAVGFNVLSNPMARVTLFRAIEEDVAVATPPIRLVQESAEQKGMVIYLPVRKLDSLTGTLPPESINLGVVASVIRLGDFFASTSIQKSDRLVEQRMLDLGASAELLYSTPDIDRMEKILADEGLRVTRELEIAGRQWHIDYLPGEGFIENYNLWASWVVLIGGLLFSALLSGWLLSLTGRNIQVKLEVNEKTQFLREEMGRRQRLEDQSKKLSLAVEHSPNMVVMSDAQGNIEYVNPKFSEVSGYALDDVLGQNISLLHADDQDGISYQEIWSQLREKHEWQGEVLNQRKDGRTYWAEVGISAIFNQENKCVSYVSVHQDVTESKRFNEQISYQASHDPLTGLINRREFERRLKHIMETAALEQIEHAFCFLDLDQFKVVNDSSGHVAGDELLKQLAAMLQDRIRKVDTLARLGGDEFGILMEGCTVQNAQRMAEEIRESVAQFRFSWEDRLYTVGVSIGLVAIDQYTHSTMEVLKQADTACYAAKDGGRNRIHLYKEDDEVLSRRSGEMHWVADINAALEEDRFELFGQLIRPIQKQERACGVEILLRMRDREGQLVPPGAFLSAAERYNVSIRIDQWVITHVFDWLQSVPDIEQRIAYCALNLSALSLGDKAIMETINSQLDRQLIAPEMIRFEITETTAIANLVEAKRFIEGVKSHGCQFALDDFGSGLSSFAYLKNLPVDVLKIDGLFVKDIMHDQIDFAMVKSINEVGHVMGMETIAEFVENDEILERLAGIGVDYAQGYGVCRPLPLAELLLHPLLEDRGSSKPELATSGEA